MDIVLVSLAFPRHKQPPALTRKVCRVIFANEIETAKEQVASLEAQQVDAIIAIVHCGNGDAPVTSKMIAQGVDGIDVIIDGHSHSQENEIVKVIH